MLTKTNYNDWSLLMKMKLQARQLWNAVEFGDFEFHEDRLVLDALLTSVPSEMVASLADKPTAKDAWDSITATHVSLDRAQKATM
jgi:phenylalanine-4-hydroxylase